MEGRDKIRYVLLGLVGLVLLIGGANSDKDAQVYIGVGVMTLALLAAWWHADLAGRKSEGKD